MNITIQMRVDSSDGDDTIVDITTLEREALCAASLGLTLAEGKAILRRIQEAMTEHQVERHSRTLRWCPRCGNALKRNGCHTLVLRTAFGKLRFPSPRFKHCTCVHASSQTFSPFAELFANRTTPELAYLQAKWASLVSYGMTVSLLNDTLPVDGEVSTSSVRRQLHRVAERSESELGQEHYSYIDGCPRDWENLPRPDPLLTVGLDGGYVRGREGASRSEGHFEVIVGKSMAESDSKCIAFVNRYDKKPKCRLFRMLKGQGMQFNQRVTFLSDCGDTVRDLQLYLNPQADHVLDWFHLVRQEVACLIVWRRAFGDPTWCPITSTLGGTAMRQRFVESHLTMYPQPQGCHQCREDEVDLRASTGSGARVNGMARINELSINIVNQTRGKDAVSL